MTAGREHCCSGIVVHPEHGAAQRRDLSLAVSTVSAMIASVFSFNTNEHNTKKNNKNARFVLSTVERLLQVKRYSQCTLGNHNSPFIRAEVLNDIKQY